jgi:RNA polymerase sigma-70 factor (ECF subfamily)
VTQDVLVEVHRSLDRFEGRARLLTWMLGVARNLCLRRRRAAARSPLGRPAEPDVLLSLPDTAIDLEAGLTQRERTEIVRTAIEQLAAEPRAVLLLREIEGLSYEEIASVLAIPLGTVRSRLHNARAALAERLAGRRA